MANSIQQRPVIAPSVATPAAPAAHLPSQLAQTDPAISSRPLPSHFKTNTSVGGVFSPRAATAVASGRLDPEANKIFSRAEEYINTKTQAPSTLQHACNAALGRTA